MPKNVRTGRSFQAALRLDPERVFDRIEDENVTPTSTYRRRVEDIIRRQLKGYGPDLNHEATLLRRIQGGCALEYASRCAGFVIGFEYYRNLMLSGAAKAKPGAR